MGCAVDKMALRKVFLPVLRFSPDNNIPPWIFALIYYKGINYTAVSGGSSETSYHSTDMNNNKNNTKLHEVQKRWNAEYDVRLMMESKTFGDSGLGMLESVT